MPFTLEVYAHLFEQADHAVAAREALEASYAAMRSSTRPGIAAPAPGANGVA